MDKIQRRFSDTRTMVSRSMKHTTRHVDILIMTAVLPILQLLLLVYVFGGSMSTGTIDYLDFVLPGILLLSIGSCASMAAVTIKEDITKGIVDRFRTMDIMQSSVLSGHMVATLLRISITVILVMTLSLIMGFRPDINITSFSLIVLLLFLFSLAYTWIAILWGLVSPSVEGAGALSYLGMLLPYLSSCFVPIESMPSVIQGFSKYQPFTPLADSIRGLFLGLECSNQIIVAIAWCIGLFILACGASIRIYNARAK